MAQVVVHVGGHDYRLACRDGEEARLERLGQYLDRKAEDLQQSLGQVSESRLLLMAALLVVDELIDLREKQEKAEDAEDEKPSTPIAPPTIDGVEPEQVGAFLSDTISAVNLLTKQLAAMPDPALEDA